MGAKQWKRLQSFKSLVSILILLHGFAMHYLRFFVLKTFVYLFPIFDKYGRFGNLHGKIVTITQASSSLFIDEFQYWYFFGRWNIIIIIRWNNCALFWLNMSEISGEIVRTFGFEICTEQSNNKYQRGTITSMKGVMGMPGWALIHSRSVLLFYLYSFKALLNRSVLDWHVEGWETKLQNWLCRFTFPTILLRHFVWLIINKTSLMLHFILTVVH